VVATEQRDELATFLKARGIATGIHYPVPSHRQPALESLTPPALLRTEKLVDEILSLPMSAQHTDAEIDEVVAAVREFFAR
jgi:dTDP-4-amino-4,6-dideoxygalactose transaminase